MAKKQKLDWRKRPRKPAEQLRKPAIGVKLTDEEAAAIRANAAQAGLTITAYIVARCCRA
jgi:uncharacterized protein (DUF1778 family)